MWCSEGVQEPPASGVGFSMVSGFCPKAQPTPLPRRHPHRREGRQRLVAQTSPLGAPNGVGGGLWDQLRSGKTPAHLAAQYGHSNLVPVLLAAGPGAQTFSTPAFSHSLGHTPCELVEALRMRSTFLTVSTMLPQCSHSSWTGCHRCFAEFHNARLCLSSASSGSPGL